MTKLFDTESQEWRDAKEVSSHVDLAEMYLEVAQKGNLNHINQFFAQDVKPKWQKDFDARNIKRDIYNWVDEAHGTFFSHEIDKELDIPDKKYRSKLLKLLEKEGKIEKCKDRPGKWRKVDQSRLPMEWWRADNSPIEIRLPLGIHKYVKVFKKTIIVFAGAADSGKSTACFETAMLNMDLFPQIDLYFSEMHEEEVKDRFVRSGNSEEYIRQHINVIQKWSDFGDAINPDGFSIIDYLKAPVGDSKMVGDWLTNIKRRLKNGVCIVAIQKQTFNEWGYGGEPTLWDPSIYVALNHGIAKCIKGRPAWDRKEQLVDKVIEFDANESEGLKLIEKGRWHYEGDDPGGKKFLPESKFRG